MRRYKWQAKAAAEQMAAHATWFTTWTFKPACRARILSAATAMGDEASQHDRLVKAAGWYVSAYMKRLRKDGFRLRYMAVPEPHRDGFPHWHGLVFAWSPMKDTDLIAEWSYGWSVVKGVRDTNAIRYVTKYLAKARYGRIRASARFGDHEHLSRLPGSRLAVPDSLPRRAWNPLVPTKEAPCEKTTKQGQKDVSELQPEFI